MFAFINTSERLHYKIKDSDVSLTEQPNGELLIKVENSTDPEKFKCVAVLANYDTDEQLTLNKISTAQLIMMLDKFSYLASSKEVARFIFQDFDIHKLIDDNMQLYKNRLRKINPAKFASINAILHKYYSVADGLREFCKACDIDHSTFSTWLHKYKLPAKKLYDRHAKFGKDKLPLLIDSDDKPIESFRRKFGNKIDKSGLAMRQKRTGLIR